MSVTLIRLVAPLFCGLLWFDSIGFLDLGVAVVFGCVFGLVMVCILRLLVGGLLWFGCYLVVCVV